MDAQIILAILGCFCLLSKTSEAHMLPKRQVFNGGQDLGESIRLAASGMINRVGVGLNNQFGSFVLPTVPPNQVEIVLPGSNSTRIFRELSDDLNSSNQTFTSDSNITTTLLQRETAATGMVNGSSIEMLPVENSSATLHILSPGHSSNGTDSGNSSFSNGTDSGNSRFDLEVANSSLLPTVFSSTNIPEPNISNSHFDNRTSTTAGADSTIESSTVVSSTQGSDSVNVSGSSVSTTSGTNTSTVVSESFDANVTFAKSQTESNKDDETKFLDVSSPETTPESKNFSLSVLGDGSKNQSDLLTIASTPLMVESTKVTVVPRATLANSFPADIRKLTFPQTSGAFIASSAGALTPNRLSLQLGSDKERSIINSKVNDPLKDHVTTVPVTEGMVNLTSFSEEANKKSSTTSSAGLENGKFAVEREGNQSFFANATITESPMVVLFSSPNGTGGDILNVTYSSLTSPVSNETASMIGNATFTATTAQPLSVAITNQNSTPTAVSSENETTPFSTTTASAINNKNSSSVTSVTSFLTNTTTETHTPFEVTSSTIVTEVTTRSGQEVVTSVVTSTDQAKTETKLQDFTNQTDNNTFPNPNVTNFNGTNPNVTNFNGTNSNVTNFNGTNSDVTNPNVTNFNATKLKFFNQLNHLEVLNSTIPLDWFINATTESPAKTTKFVIFNLFAADLDSPTPKAIEEGRQTNSTIFEASPLFLISAAVPSSNQTSPDLKKESKNGTGTVVLLTSNLTEATSQTQFGEFNKESSEQNQNVTNPIGLNSTASISSFQTLFFNPPSQQINSSFTKTDLNKTETSTISVLVLEGAVTLSAFNNSDGNEQPSTSFPNPLADNTTSTSRNKMEFHFVRPKDKEEYQMAASEYLNETVPLEHHQLGNEQNGTVSGSTSTNTTTTNTTTNTNTNTNTNSTSSDNNHRSQLGTVVPSDLSIANQSSSLNENSRNETTTISSIQGKIHQEPIVRNFLENSVFFESRKNGASITIETGTKNLESNVSVAARNSTTVPLRPASDASVEANATTLPSKNLTTSVSGFHRATWSLPSFEGSEDNEVPQRMLFLPGSGNSQLQFLSAPTVKTLRRKNLVLMTTARPTATSPRTVYIPEDPEDEKKFWSLIPKPLNAAQVSRLRMHSSREVLYPTYEQVPRTSFSCSNVSQPGYYADAEAGCQAYHRCDIFGSHFKFLCPKTTLFSQLTLVCDYWYNVNCNEQVKQADYINSRLYRGMNYSHSRFNYGSRQRSLLSTGRPSVATTVASDETASNLPVAKSMMIPPTTANQNLRLTTKTPEVSAAGTEPKISAGRSSFSGPSQTNSTLESVVENGTASSLASASSTIFSGIEEP